MLPSVTSANHVNECISNSQMRQDVKASRHIFKLQFAGMQLATQYNFPLLSPIS